MTQPEVLSQEFELGYTYTRSTGPIIGRFLTELRRKKLVGIKGSDGRVYAPPMEFDPQTTEALSEFVEVGQSGEVVSWCWVSEPRASHPHSKPFAWALIRLDGADVPMLHSVCSATEAGMRTGMRVSAQWVDEPQGSITDIACFVPENAAAAAQGPEKEAETDQEMINGIEVPVSLTYQYTAGEATSRYLSQVRQGQLTGQRCPRCRKVYIPPRGSCPACGVATDEEVALSDKCTVESFTIVHIPIPGNPIQPPYIIANLVADGANISFIHLLSECVNEEVRKGQRVQALWKPMEEWDYAMDNIRYFRPIDEPDVPVDRIGKLPVSGWEG